MCKTIKDWYHAQPPTGGPWARLRGEHALRFIVPGGTRVKHMPAQPMQHVGEINLLDPDLVMHIGVFRHATKWQGLPRPH